MMVIAFFSCNHSETRGTTTSTAGKKESKHSNAYNSSVTAALDQYEQLTDAFVRWDSAAIPALAQSLQRAVDSLWQDTTGNTPGAAKSLDSTKHHMARIVSANSLEGKRKALHAFSQHFYGFLQSSGFDTQPLYLQLCPMAFNDVEDGLWISRGDSIRNPYLGLHHPRYGRGMLACGEVKEVLNGPAAGKE